MTSYQTARLAVARLGYEDGTRRNLRVIDVVAAEAGVQLDAERWPSDLARCYLQGFHEGAVTPEGRRAFAEKFPHLAAGRAA